jgi:hypothetical protein
LKNDLKKKKLEKVQEKRGIMEVKIKKWDKLKIYPIFMISSISLNTFSISSEVIDSLPISSFTSPITSLTIGCTHSGAVIFIFVAIFF